MAGGLPAGPSALGALWPSGQTALFTPSVPDAMNVVAYLGLVMFTLGYELRVDRLLAPRPCRWSRPSPCFLHTHDLQDTP